MNNKMTHLEVDEGVDIIELIKIFYIGKWKIFISTLFLLVIGYIYIANLPSNFRIIIDVSKTSDSNFLKYFKLNNISQISTSKVNTFDITNSDLSNVEISDVNLRELYTINSHTIFDSFIYKVKNKNNIVEIITNSEIFNSTSDKPKEEIIYEKSKSLKLIFGTDLNESHKIIFFWSNKDQIRNLLEQIIYENLKGVKQDVINDLNVIIDLITFINSRKKEEITSRIKVLSSYESEEIINTQLIFLKEQLAVVENDTTTVEIKKIIEEFSQENPKSFIDYDISFAEVDDFKKINHKYSLIIFAFIGFLLGSSFIVLSNFNKKIIK